MPLTAPPVVKDAQLAATENLEVGVPVPTPTLAFAVMINKVLEAAAMVEDETTNGLRPPTAVIDKVAPGVEELIPRLPLGATLSIVAPLEEATLNASVPPAVP